MPTRIPSPSKSIGSIRDFFFGKRPPQSPSEVYTGRPDNSGSKRPPRSPRGVTWLPRAIDLASKFHQEPSWRRPTRLLLVGSVQFPAGSVKAIWVCTRPKQPKPDSTKVQPNFLQSHPVSRD
ncbi:hypothetical protein CRG98_046825 [Punica granatum]|uniref:Uncharacterized protein n=1 Tax=Punica granatum TaxID=22663 RepID=A0A2I0HM17_PUNGR|nr:hypothetical protein CRG98_046825 [Punica granatum]